MAVRLRHREQSETNIFINLNTTDMEKKINYIVVVVNDRKVIQVLYNNWVHDKEEIKTYLWGITMGMSMAGRKNITSIAMLADDFTNVKERVTMNERAHNMEIFLRDYYWPRVNTKSTSQDD